MEIDLLRKLPGASRVLYTALQAASPEALPLLTLARAVWPDGIRPADPLNALQQHISRLHRALSDLAQDKAVEYVTREGGPPGWRLASGRRQSVPLTNSPN